MSVDSLSLPGWAQALLVGADIEVIGSVAAVLTTGSFLPQVWLTLRSRDVSGISLGMYSAFTLGVGLWLVYGLAKQSWPMVIANGFTLALALTILGMKLWFGRRSRPPQIKAGSR